MDEKRISMNTTAAVVVTYNRKELLSQCITKPLGQVGVSCDIFVIDSASTDGAQEMVAHDYSGEERVRYYNIGANLGGAAG